MHPLHVHMLPELAKPESLAGGVAVIFDVLRASTTICSALHAGASRIRICLTLDEAMHEARQLRSAGECVVLGGERGGMRPDGFDLGNSPDEYTPATLAHKAVVFTTTNGTRAAIHSKQAHTLLIGCLGNTSAVVRHAAAADRPIHLLCAGTEGEVSLEDVLGAGAVVAGLLDHSGRTGSNAQFQPDDAAMIARDVYSIAAANAGGIESALRSGKGGRNVERLGLGRDIARCAQVDWCPIAPRLDPATMTLTPARL